MNNYLEEIEAEYSRIGGKYSPLSPIDWHLAAAWQEKEIPLRVVLTAMSETWRNFEAKANKGIINTLRYFEQEVEKQFAQYSAAQIGKIVPIEIETFVCLNCKSYENDTEDFYKGWCRNENTIRDSDGENCPNIFKARERCNQECEDEPPEFYQFFEARNL